MVFNLEFVALFAGLIWLIALTVFLWQYIQHYNKLTAGVSEKTLKSLLDNLLKEVSDTQKQTKQLTVRCDKIEKEETLYIRKIGLLRFNPFKDTGGDQSFILALLSSQDCGIVISNLYSRSGGSRWYAKKILGGKSVDHELSDEEKQVLKQAK